MNIRWNTFVNCVDSCIWASNSNYDLVDSNTLTGGGAPTVPAIIFSTNVSNNVISRNRIQNFKGTAIAVRCTGAEICNHVTIDRNLILTVDTNSWDSGAIGLMDRGHHSVGLRVIYNRIDGDGTASTNTRSIYLDDQTSNVFVFGNICRRCGSWALQIHGGDHNIIRGNIFDVSWGAKVGYYQSAGYYGHPSTNYGMQGNIFQQNIIYSSGGFPSSLWTYLNQSSTPIAPLNNSSNVYWSASGASIPNTVIPDTRFYRANPLFLNASAGDYRMPSHSPAFSLVGFPTLPTDQGPLPFPTLLPR